MYNDCIKICVCVCVVQFKETHTLTLTQQNEHIATTGDDEREEEEEEDYMQMTFISITRSGRAGMRLLLLPAVASARFANYYLHILTFATYY